MTFLTRYRMRSLTLTLVASLGLAAPALGGSAPGVTESDHDRRAIIDAGLMLDITPKATDDGAVVLASHRAFRHRAGHHRGHHHRAHHHRAHHHRRSYHRYHHGHHRSFGRAHHRRFFHDHARHGFHHGDIRRHRHRHHHHSGFRIRIRF